MVSMECIPVMIKICLQNLFLQDEVDVFFQSPSQTECNDDDNSRKMNVYDYEKYEKSYAKLDDSNKWVLTTAHITAPVTCMSGNICYSVKKQCTENSRKALCLY